MVERANHLAVLDPAVSERAVGVGTSSDEGVEAPAVVENRDPKPVDFDRRPSPLADVAHLADRSESRQDPRSLSNRPMPTMMKW